MNSKGLENIMINWVVSKARDLLKKVTYNVIMVEAERDKIDRYQKLNFELI